MQVDQLSSLRKIDKAIISALDSHQIFEVVLNQFHEHLQVDAASIFLVDPKSHSLYIANGQGFNMHTFQQLDVAEQTLEQGKTLVLNAEANGKNEVPYPSAFLTKGILQCISVPLYANSETIGVLEGYYRSNNVEIISEWIEFTETIAGQTAIAVEHVRLMERYQNLNNELLMAHETILEGWAKALEFKDRETKGHSYRVTDMTLKIGQELGLDENELVNMRRGALLHDIGKMGIPDTILLKPGPLDDREWAVMKQHPLYAQEFLNGIGFLKSAMIIPLYHHERWNGSGYPFGLSGEDIPLPARIFAVVDVWDALSYDRPYRDAWSESQVLKYIKNNSGTLFDPHIVETFMHLVKS